jgi:hypothetical protein
MYHKQNVNYTLNKDIKTSQVKTPPPVRVACLIFYYIFTFRKSNATRMLFWRHKCNLFSYNLFTPEQPDRPWRPLSLQPNGYTALWPRVSDRDVKLATHLHIMHRLKISGAMTLLPRIPSCCERGNFTFTLPTFNLTSVIIIGLSVTFKSQPTSHCISFLPHLHYALLLSFYPLTSITNTYLIAKSTAARSPCYLHGNESKSSQSVHQNFVT